MRLPAALVALAASLITATAAAQQPPAPPAPPAPWSSAPAPYAAPPYAASTYAGPWVPPPQIPVTERRSNGMRITGIVLWALGGVTTGVGMALVGVAMTHPCVYYDAFADTPLRAAAQGERIGTGRQALNSCEAPGTIGIGMFTAGVLTGALAIPFFVVGNSQVRVKPQPLAAAPELHIGPTGAAMSFRF